jgi:hypothetical protein
LLSFPPVAVTVAATPFSLFVAVVFVVTDIPTAAVAAAATAAVATTTVVTAIVTTATVAVVAVAMDGELLPDFCVCVAMPKNPRHIGDYLNGLFKMN